MSRGPVIDCLLEQIAAPTEHFDNRQIRVTSREQQYELPPYPGVGGGDLRTFSTRGVPAVNTRGQRTRTTCGTRGDTERPTCRPPLAPPFPLHGASPIAPLRPIRAPAVWYTQRAPSAPNPGRRDRRTCSSPPLPLCTLTSPHRVPACTGLATAPPSTCRTTWPCCTMRAPSRSRDCSYVACTTKILASSAEMWVM